METSDDLKYRKTVGWLGLIHPSHCPVHTSNRPFSKKLYVKKLDVTSNFGVLTVAPLLQRTLFSVGWKSGSRGGKEDLPGADVLDLDNNHLLS